MSQEIEIEFKNLLTKEAFDYLLKAFPFPTNGQTQVNYYFETEQFDLQKNKCALRIREKNNTYQLTLKEPHPDGILETHDHLSHQEANNWLAGHITYKPHINEQLKQFNISLDTLKYYGNLKTIRYEVNVQDVLLVLDHSTYHGHSDYELEIEARDKQTGIDFFNNILERHDIEKKETPNKIERFFNTRPK